MKKNIRTLLLLVIAGLGVTAGFQSCGKKSGLGVGGKLIVLGSGN